MEKKYYANSETQKLESLEELKDFYEQDKGTDENYCTFSEWLETCMFYNNGALDEVEKIDKSYFEKLYKDRKINQETCDFWTSLNTEIYKTKDNHFYTLDGHSAYSIEDLKIDV